jgi:hypothetical protein
MNPELSVYYCYISGSRDSGSVIYMTIFGDFIGAK